MDIKRIIGALLTVFGIIGLVYEVVLFSNGNGGMRNTKELIFYGILGVLFCASGIGLVRPTKEEL